MKPQMVDSPPEEDQKALDMWSDAEETLSNRSDSESVYEDASSQLQTILFPIPSVEQKLNGTNPDILDDSDLGSFEADSSFNKESDNPTSQTLGLNPSLGSALIAGCKPSSWLVSVNKEQEGGIGIDATVPSVIGIAVLSAIGIAVKGPTYNSENDVTPSRH
ncbi:hypothetical protein K435DRAFT_793402 [Dendrothele bispora CBS 962.96]|uniref:Uncharacterized protein n=1 Tax=Dendrothele bispora (strain CBS 962.96) TaxID=1314807 RepID=A0A4S8MFB5_DENBC|nr:hypothetical protein K435DRAFT_793402 [Dendrothele bispora CBS 962.96]